MKKGLLVAAVLLSLSTLLGLLASGLDLLPRPASREPSTNTEQQARIDVARADEKPESKKTQPDPKADEPLPLPVREPKPKDPLWTPAKALDWKFDRDDQGRLVSSIDPARRQTKIRYEQSEKQLLVTKESADGSRVIRKFDELGRLRVLDDSLGTVRYDYDDFGRLTSVQRKGALPIEYEYDTQDRVVAARIGKDWRVGYRYDFLGRIESITTPVGQIAYAHRPAEGLIMRTLPGGISTVWRYHPSGRLESIEHAGKDRNLLARFVYLQCQ